LATLQEGPLAGFPEPRTWLTGLEITNISRIMAVSPRGLQGSRAYGPGCVSSFGGRGNWFGSGSFLGLQTTGLALPSPAVLGGPFGPRVAWGKRFPLGFGPRGARGPKTKCL